MTLTNNWAITAPSEIRIDFPFLETAYSLHFFSSTGSVLCSSLGTINGGVTCAYASSKILTTTGAFSSDVATNTVIKLRLQSVLTPLSTTPLV